MKKFDVNSLTPIAVQNEKALIKDTSVEFFQDGSKALEVLTLALQNGDREAFHEILSGYLCVINKEELSRRSKVPIATIRRIAAGANFNVDTLLKITSAIYQELNCQTESSAPGRGAVR